MNIEELQEGLADHETRLIALEQQFATPNSALTQVNEFSKILEDEVKFTEKQQLNLKTMWQRLNEQHKLILSLQRKIDDSLVNFKALKKYD